MNGDCMNEETKIEELMHDHLKSVGWPDCPHPDEVVMQNLGPMFEKLVHAGLAQPEHWDQYVLAAQMQYHFRK